MQKKIYVSGMHSGPNPSSGLGIVRCLRKAFPHLRLIGVEHWQGSSGIHDEAVDDVLLLPTWSQIHDESHAERVRSLLDDGHLWISAMDMEVHWLAEHVGPHPNLLAPSAEAVERTAKPAVRALEGLGFEVPDWVSVDLPDSELHAFLRHHCWRCWLKSPFHDARRISSWADFERARDQMAEKWKTSRLFVQRHVIGNEETVAFAAYQGELLSAIHMEKRLTTIEGKTWSARVRPADPELVEQLRPVIRSLEWSGGGEIEFARDPDGRKWIIECNPRFPAWLYGGAVVGMNLPARLIAHVWKLPLLEEVAAYPFFTRVVQEIPARQEIGIPAPQDPSVAAWTVDGKSGKGFQFVAGYVPQVRDPGAGAGAGTGTDDADEDDARDGSELAAGEPVTTPPELQAEIAELARAFAGETPTRAFLPEWTRRRFGSLRDRARSASRGRGPEVRVGYSVKTSPTDEHLRLAQECGFLAECISQAEVRRALGMGYRPDQVILNGPGKFWPLTQEPVRGLHLLFCDSMEEFDRVAASPGMAEAIGFRVRIPSIHSRFGNTFTEFGGFERLVSAIRRIPRGADLGFHFHMPSWAIGVQRWMHALESLLHWCQTIELAAGRPVRRVDLGGGFFPNDLEKLDLAAVRARVAEALPEARAMYLEPGRALTQESEALVSRVLDVRRTPEGELNEIVVDACIAELPLARSFPHRVFHRPGAEHGSCKALRKGEGRILGRICMEDDILCHDVELPESLAIGDLLIFGDAGGYERTMSYGFGRG